MKKRLLFLGMTIVVFLVFFTMVTMITQVPVLADDNDTIIMDVNVSETASVIVLPATLNWTSVAAGTAGGIRNITVKNSGSLNVSSIYAYIDTLYTEQARPYASGNSSLFSAGGVITIKNETDPKYYFAGRIEWNWTQEIPNADFSAVDVLDATAWGYFRNASSDYVWVLGNGTETRCNESNAQFSIETQVDLGTAATRTPDNTFSISTSSNDPENWGYASITTGPLSGHCVAASTACDKIFIYNFDKRSNFTDCTNAEFVYAGNLTPGSTFILQVDSWIPYGYPAGFLNQTTLTIYASSV